MKLPLTIVPSSTVMLPVLKKEYRVRAMNIREEKNLLTAKDAGNTDDVLFAINELVKECTYGNLDFDTLAVPDVVALFVKIIELSKGPTCVHTYICRNTVQDNDNQVECGQEINVTVDLRTIKFSEGNTNNLIELQDGITIELMYPTPEIYKAAINDSKVVVQENGKDVTKINEAEARLRAYAYCIKSVIQGENIYTEYTHDEVYNWLLDMNETVLKRLIDFFNNIPTASLTYDVVCPKCGHKETITLTGLDDFFTQDIPGILS